MKKNTDKNKLSPELLDILVCPITRSTLLYDEKNNELISKQAGLAYPIKNGIPIMLAKEARKIIKD
jgi:uncharacterized protein YbaR (Trm112 family)